MLFFRKYKSHGARESWRWVWNNARGNGEKGRGIVLIGMQRRQCGGEGERRNGQQAIHHQQYGPGIPVQYKVLVQFNPAWIRLIRRILAKVICRICTVVFVHERIFTRHFWQVIRPQTNDWQNSPHLFCCCIRSRIHIRSKLCFGVVMHGRVTAPLLFPYFQCTNTRPIGRTRSQPEPTGIPVCVFVFRRGVQHCTATAAYSVSIPSFMFSSGIAHEESV